MFGNDVCEDVVYTDSDDIDDEVVEDCGHVEIVFDAANPDDVGTVLDNDVVADYVCTVVVVILLDDDIVEVDEVDVLVDVVIVVSLIAVTNDKAVYEVGIDHLNDVVVRLPPADVVLDVGVVVDDVEDDVSQLIENDAMRPAGSNFRCTRMCD